MEQEVMGTVVKVSQQGWLKFNTKPVRAHSLDGSIFPHIIEVQYVVDGKQHICKQWLDAGGRVPDEGDSIKVVYQAEKPTKAHLKI